MKTEKWRKELMKERRRNSCQQPQNEVAQDFHDAAAACQHPHGTDKDGDNDQEDKEWEHCC